MKKIPSLKWGLNKPLLLLIALILTACAPAGVQNMGIFAPSRTKSILGQDGCTPVPMGKIMMWSFGDTILGSWKKEISVDTTFEDSAVMNAMISNSLAFSAAPTDQNISRLHFTYLKDSGKVTKFIRYRPGENPFRLRFWGADGILLENTVYVYYMVVLIDKKFAKENPGSLPFRVLGMGLARWNRPADWKIGMPVRFKRLGRLFFRGEPLFGDAIIQRGKFLYLIGHGRGEGSGIDGFLARVPVKSIRFRRAYSFLYKNREWGPDIKKAHPFFRGVSGEPSLSYNEYLKSFTVIYCGRDQTIRMTLFRTFKELGRIQPRVIYTPPPLPEIKGRSKLFYYSGKEIFYTASAIYAIYINPAIYQPILIKIPYSAIKKM